MGYPVDATPGVAGGYRLAAGAHVPPLLFDDEEAVAIVVGLRAAAGAAISGIEDTSLRALAKLEGVLPDRVRRRVSALYANTAVLRWSGADAEIEPEVLGVLAQACRDSEEVRFAYKARTGEETHRLVQPKQMVSVGRRWYLVAWDVRRDDWRTFRLDRMTNPALAGVRFESRALPTEDAASFVAEALRQSPMPYRATVTMSCSEDELRDVARWLDSEVEVVGDGRCRIELRSDTEGWLTTMAATLATNFEIEIDADERIAALFEKTGNRLAGSTA